ncbi:MAG: LPS assembly protein LptD [Pseudobdellovibrionaceae bacterium]|nr:LPS assembly protein LptD [Bdellovibrionales bacterium]USN48238.1 MAG: LPS assembly protein LptD [Pseudobdellovibrionaceae bacterium]
MKMTSLISNLRTVSIILTWGLVTGMLPVPAKATTATVSGLSLRANTMLRDSKKKQVVLKGNVQLGFKDLEVRCDHATIDLKNKTITAIGHVIFQTETLFSESDEVIYNYDTGKGTFKNGYIQSGSVLFEGDVVEKTGENSFVAHDAKYTACTTCPPAWSFSGRTIEAELGGYAWIKIPVLSIATLPVLILPEIAVPLKSTRQSGLLAPEFSYSDSGGTAIAQSYFWAIDRHLDLTLTAKHYAKRGWKGLFEQRYMLSKESHGSISGAYNYDNAFKLADGSLGPANRGFIRYQHRHSLPHNMIHRAEINFATDLRYPGDFPEEMSGFGDSALENRISLTQNLENQHRSIEAAYYVNLLQTDPKAPNRDAVHRFPEIRMDITEQKLGSTDFYFNMDLNFTYFARLNSSFDDVINGADGLEVTGIVDTTFDPTIDLVRSGQRFYVNPTLSYPFHIGPLLDIRPSLTYHEGHYFFAPSSDIATSDYSQHAIRRYLQTDVSAKTQLSSIFETEAEENQKYPSAFKHEIEPEIIFSTIPWTKRPDHSFFGDFDDQPYRRRAEPVSDGDFNGTNRIQFDYQDRLFAKRLINLILTQRIIRKLWYGDIPTYKNTVLFRLSQSYDLNVLDEPEPKPWSRLDSLLNVNSENVEIYAKASYHPYAGAVNSSSRLRWLFTPQNFMDFTYSQNFVIDENDIFDYGSRAEYWGLGGGLASKYVDLTGHLNFSAISNIIESWETQANLKPPGRCWGIVMSLRKVIDRDFYVNFEFNFDFGGNKLSGNET